MSRPSAGLHLDSSLPISNLCCVFCFAQILYLTNVQSSQSVNEEQLVHQLWGNKFLINLCIK